MDIIRTIVISGYFKENLVVSHKYANAYMGSFVITEAKELTKEKKLVLTIIMQPLKNYFCSFHVCMCTFFTYLYIQSKHIPFLHQRQVFNAEYEWNGKQRSDAIGFLLEKRILHTFCIYRYVILQHL